MKAFFKKLKHSLTPRWYCTPSAMLYYRCLHLKSHYNPYRGICAQLDHAGCGMLMTKLMKQWPGSTGHYLFPIPDPSDCCKCPDKAARIFSSTDRMWEGAYGALRMELLDYMIEQTKG